MDPPTPLIVALSKPEYDVSSCDELAKELEPAHAQPNVIVDMTEVRYLDSTCLSKLARMRTERQKRDYPPARLVVPAPQVRRLFEIVGFDKVWPLYDSLEEALGQPPADDEEDARVTG